MRRIAAAFLPAVALVAALAPAARAAPIPLDAPYAQAAAYVDGAGTLLEAKNIVSTQKWSTGIYCVKVTDDIDVAKSLPMAQPNWAGIARVGKGAHSHCGNDARILRVYTLDTNGNYVDSAFRLVVH
ncbi:hypothetical protein ACWCQL_36065 [Streptomyces sp. NPDC002073]